MRSGPLALTLGDPAGIGPEIIVGAWRALRETGPTFFVIGDAQSVASAPKATAGMVRAIGSPHDAATEFRHAIPVLDLPLRAPVVAGQPSAESAPAIIRWIETAVGLALAGTVRGVVTA